LRNWLTVLLLSFLLLSWPQASSADPVKEEVTIVDDGWVEVPLDFAFPFYGNTYVTSFMFSNGVIGFLDPLNIPGTGIVYDGLCCNSFDFTASNNNYGNYGGVRFDYVIMPWHTDLIDIGTGKFFIQGDDTFQSYFWENISEYYDQTNLNTFDTTIYPLGNIRFSYQAVDVQNHSVTIAIIGDLSAGEYTQWFYNNPSTDGGVYWTSGTQLLVEIEAGQSICEVDSTASYVCTYYAVGYAEEIYGRACAASALYDSGCPGYAAAYLAQQCSLNTTYNPSCPGYETAYIDNQCILDPLYSPSCAGYSAATAEEEAETSYEGDDWVGYATYEPEMTFDDSEIFDSNNFSIPTNTYDTAVEPEFEAFDTTFEGVFAELEIEITLTEEGFNEPIEETEFEEFAEQESDESTENEETSTNDVEEEISEEEVLDDEQDEQQEEEAEEEDEGSTDEEDNESLEEASEKESEEEDESAEIMMVESKGESEAEIKEPTAEQKRKAKEKKMKEIITAKLKSLAKEVGEAASLAEQVELQSFIIALLNFNLGFNSYNSAMIDGIFYVDRDIYLNMKVPENQRGLRNGLANEILHNKLVDIQYGENYGRSRI